MQSHPDSRFLITGRQTNMVYLYQILYFIFEREEDTMGWKKTLIYRSKDKADWDTAKKLLEEADIVYFPFTAQESPIPGCGGKVDPRKFLNPKPVPSRIYQIEVSTENKEHARSILDGKVLPIRSYGYSI